VLQQNNEILTEGDLIGGAANGRIVREQKDGSLRFRDVGTGEDGITGPGL
jgi:hypothetical protein